MCTLKIAIQKSGRLRDGSIELLKDCGIAIDNGADQLKASAFNFPVEVLFLRNADIPQYLEDGVADIAIIGENILVEKPKQVNVLMGLGFSRCRVSLAVPRDEPYADLSYFNGKRIATTYPNTLNAFLKEKGVVADIHEISGSVEIAPNIGLADAIFDIVSSGSTMFRNGLKEVCTVLKSQAVLASSPRLDEKKAEILRRLSFRMEAVLRARTAKYILMNVPNDRIGAVTGLLPVLKSPTVLPLALPGWSSLHSVIAEDQFWEVIDQLKLAGAEGILVVPVEKMVV